MPLRCNAAPGQEGGLPRASMRALHGLKKARLQEELSSRGLDASGNKPALVARLREAVALDAMARDVAGTVAQRGATVAVAPTDINQELLRLREEVGLLLQAALNAAISSHVGLTQLKLGFMMVHGRS